MPGRRALPEGGCTDPGGVFPGRSTAALRRRPAPTRRRPRKIIRSFHDLYGAAAPDATHAQPGSAARSPARLRA